MRSLPPLFDTISGKKSHIEIIRAYKKSENKATIRPNLPLKTDSTVSSDFRNKKY